MKKKKVIHRTHSLFSYTTPTENNLGHNNAGILFFSGVPVNAHEGVIC